MVVTKIVLALFMSGKQGRPILKDRPAHGLVFNVGCTASYRFDDGKTLVCHDGECIFLPKGANYSAKRYDIVSSKESGVYAINFLTLSDENMNAPWVLKIKGENEIVSLFSKAARAWIKKETGFYEECFSDLYKIIKQIKKEFAQYYNQQKTVDLLTPTLQYINENYTTEIIPVAKLAELCHVSEVYLRRMFQNVFSVSPAVYMRNLRLQYAKELMQTEEYSVTDVAMMSGFNDNAYFTREFKKAVGVAPLAYRKEMK